jgi:hypothetical protein
VFFAANVCTILFATIFSTFDPKISTGSNSLGVNLLVISEGKIFHLLLHVYNNQPQFEKHTCSAGEHFQIISLFGLCKPPILLTLF